MAIMIPEDRRENEFNNSIGEKVLYEELKRQLTDDYVVFHSVNIAAQVFKDHGYFVNKELDFIVFHPGKGMLCIEVKAGQIKFEDLRIHQRKARHYEDSYYTDEEFEEINPLKQIEPAVHSLIDRLGKKLPDGIEYPIRSLAAFTSINKKDLIGQLPMEYKERTMFKEDLNNLPVTLEKFFDYENGRRPKNETMSLKAKRIIMNEIAPSCDAIPILNERIKAGEMLFRKMTKDQIGVLGFLELQKEAVIEGMAGSGKTVIALEKAKRLAKNRKVLVLCFNRMIKEYMREALHMQSDNIDVMNIFDLGIEYGYIKSGQFQWQQQTQLLNDILMDEVAWQYDDLIIDEAQDYAKGILELFYKIQQKSGGHFYAFYDIHQKTHNNKSEEWLEAFQNRFPLTSNCRNTMEIAESCCRVVGESYTESKIRVSGKRPQWIISRSMEEFEKTLQKQVDYYVDQGVPIENIVLLTVKSSNDPSRVLQPDLSLNGEFNLGRYKVSKSIKEDHLLYTTARKFKGNECDVVIVLDIGCDSLSDETNKKLFYISLSRAKHIGEVHCLMSETEEAALYQSLSQHQRNDSNVLEDVLAMEKMV